MNLLGIVLKVKDGVLVSSYLNKTNIKHLLLLEPHQIKIYFNDKYFTNVIPLHYLDSVTIFTIVGLITFSSTTENLILEVIRQQILYQYFIGWSVSLLV